MEADHDIAALLQRLGPWMEGSATTPDHPAPSPVPPLSVVPDGDGALPIRIEWTTDAISVSLAEWTTSWSRNDSDAIEEVCDLVAAALTGRARVRVFRASGRAYRWEVEFRVGGAWQSHDAVRRGRGAWLRRPEFEILVNERGAPPGFELREPGALPRAPWVGVLIPPGGGGPTVVDPDGELDLHTYKPKEVGAVVKAYIEECQRRGLTQLRIVHGKGIGNLRRTVHALLERHAAVAGFRLGGATEGSWGATVVDLHPPP